MKRPNFFHGVFLEYHRQNESVDLSALSPPAMQHATTLPFKMTNTPKDEQPESANDRSSASVHEEPCRCRFNPPGTNYYVSTIDGSRYALLAGPFETHVEACGWVDRARDEACRVDPRAWFYAFGTTAMKPEYRRPGILNDRLDLDGGP